MASASAEALAKLEGVYDFEHPHGVFDVHLRSKGRFFAPKFQCKAEWHATEAGVLEIKFGKYGEYRLEITDPATRSFSGSAVGKPESWRKMKLKRPFSEAEKMLMDSQWELEHPGGKFNIEFRADGYTHFVCPDFPAHSHWSLTNDETPTPLLYINWGKYGEYELTIAADGQTMAGSAKGKPDNWRKARRLGSLGEAAAVHEHDH